MTAGKGEKTPNCGKVGMLWEKVLMLKWNLLGWLNEYLIFRENQKLMEIH